MFRSGVMGARSRKSAARPRGGPSSESEVGLAGGASTTHARRDLTAEERSRRTERIGGGSVTRGSRAPRTSTPCALYKRTNNYAVAVTTLGGLFGFPFGAFWNAFVATPTTPGVASETRRQCSIDAGVSRTAIENVGDVPPWTPASVSASRRTRVSRFSDSFLEIGFIVHSLFGCARRVQRTHQIAHDCPNVAQSATSTCCSRRDNEPSSTAVDCGLQRVSSEEQSTIAITLAVAIGSFGRPEHALAPGAAPPR